MVIIEKFKKIFLFKAITRRILPDKLYYQYFYFILFGKRFSYKNPKGFNAKLQWLKVYFRDKRMIKLADKYEVRNYVKEKIGEEYLVPLIGVYENVEEIVWEKLPEKFVLKANHGSKWNIVCTNKNQLNEVKVKKKLTKWLNSNYYRLEKEWHYNTMPPKIICENYLEKKGFQLLEIKLFCYHGITEFIVVYPSNGNYRNIYTKNWERVPCETTFKQGPEIPKPNNLNKMMDLAFQLSKDFPFLRVDFFLLNEAIYFGELTFTPSRGMYRFKPQQTDLVFGKPLKLPEIKITN